MVYSCTTNNCLLKLDTHWIVFYREREGRGRGREREKLTQASYINSSVPVQGVNSTRNSSL